MAMSMAPVKLNFLQKLPSSTSMMRRFLKPAHCAPVQQVQEEADAGIMCEPCNGKGWLLCDFCEGKKTNVKAINNRIYRRCPSCRAMRIRLMASHGNSSYGNTLPQKLCRCWRHRPCIVKIANNPHNTGRQCYASPCNIGYVLCSKCKVFKCVTFPNYSDCEDLTF